MSQIRFSNLPGVNWSFLPVKIGGFLQNAPFRNLQKQRKHQARFPFVLLPSNNDYWMCSCISSSWENGIPLNKLFIQGGRLFIPSKGKHVLKLAERHRRKVNTLGILACIFSTSLRFLKGIHFRKSLTESERSGRF